MLVFEERRGVVRAESFHVERTTRLEVTLRNLSRADRERANVALRLFAAGLLEQFDRRRRTPAS